LEAEVEIDAEVDLEVGVEIDAEVDLELDAEITSGASWRDKHSSESADAAFGQANAPAPTIQAEEAAVMKMNAAYDDIVTSDDHAAFTVNPLHMEDGEIDGAMGSIMFMEGAPSSPAHTQAQAAVKDGIQWDYAIGFDTPQIEEDASEEERQKKTEIFDNSQKNLKVLMAALQRANLSHSAPRPTPSGEAAILLIRATNQRLMIAAEERGLRVDGNPRGGTGRRYLTVGEAKAQGLKFPERELGLETYPTAAFTAAGFEAGEYVKREFGAELDGTDCQSPTDTSKGYNFKSADRCALLDYIISGNIKRGNADACGAAIDLGAWKIEERIEMFTPLHDFAELEALRERWLGWNVWKWWWNHTIGHIPPPDHRANRLHVIHQINDYFGNQIGFYFAFLGHYTWWLCPLAVTAIPISIAQYADSNLHFGMILWSFALSLWTAVFVKYWNRRANTLRYDWGVSDNQVLGYRSATRPEFVASNACCQGASDRSGFYAEKKWVPLDNYEEILPIRYKEKPERWAAKFQPSVDGSKAGVYCKVRFRNRWRCPAINHHLVFLCVVILLGVTCFLFIVKYKAKQDFGAAGGLLGALVDGFTIQLFNQIFIIFGTKMNDWENHQTHELYDNSLIMKIFTFEFINTYSSLFYVALVKPAQGEDSDGALWPTSFKDYCIVEEGSPKIDDEHQFCYDELRISYIGILVSKMIVDAAMDIALPYFLTQLKRYQTHGELQSVEATKEEQLSVENQLLMTEYDTSLWDYNQLILTFGLVAMFGMAWPFGVLLVAVYAMIQNGVDGFKLCQANQRPLRRECSGLGTWRYVIQLIGVAGVMSNVAILTYTMDWFGKHFDHWSKDAKFKAFIGLEHLLIATYLGILLVVDDNPPELQMKKALDMFEEENYRYDKVQERETTSLFNEIDTNNDGIISQEEFMESEKVQAHISELVKQANEPGHGRDEEIEL